jgi:translation initiation factor 2 alpha subunit (eIF-2alpha)
MPRFYKEEMPELDSVVIIRITIIGDNAVYGEMLEYGNIEAMIPISEIFIKRYRTVKDYLRVGMNLPAQVIRIEGATIDLSLKHVKEEEGAAAMIAFKRAYKADHIIRVAAKQDTARIEEFYEHIWNHNTRDTYGLFETARTMEIELPAELLAIIHQKIQVKTYTAEKEVIIRFGIYPDGVQRLVSELNRISSMEGISILVVAPPRYKITASSSSLVDADARLSAALAGLQPVC